MNQQFLQTSHVAFQEKVIIGIVINGIQKGCILFCLLFFCFLTVLHAQINLDSGLVAYYPFNGNANDESDYGRNGTVAGATLTADRFGIDNKAYSFISSYIQIGDYFDNTATLTFSFWVNAKTNNQITILGKYKTDITHTSYHISCLDGKILLDVSNNLQELLATTINNTIQIDTWQHYVCVFDLSQSDIQNRFKIYCNGVVQSINVDCRYGGENIHFIEDTTVPFNIGKVTIGGGASPYNMYGMLDDVRIYSRVLNQDDITELYNEAANMNAGFFNLTPVFSNTDSEYSDIKIQAYPIDSTSTIALANQNAIIKPDSILSRNICSLIARFSWNNHPSGIYDALLISQGDTAKLKDCFTLIHLTKAQEPLDTDNDGYRNISAYADLVWMFENDHCWSWNFEFDNDIDASESEFWYEGKGLSLITDFSGVIDGHGHKIKFLHINRTAEKNVAFIGTLASSGIVRNLGLTNCSITGGDYSASLVGRNSGGTISHCYATGSVRGYNYVGGITSDNKGTIKSCFNAALINGEGYIGGLTGNNSDLITESYNIGKVIGRGINTGGISSVNSGTIVNCFNAGTVIGSGHVAGISALNYGEISVVYNRGYINGTGSALGAISGHGNTVTNSFWDNESSGLTTSEGGTGKTAAEMKTQSTFANWDFENIWEILSTLNDGYPQLAWAKTTSLIKSYSPERIANVGKASIVFEGIGFDDNTRVFLVGEKLDTIKADAVLIEDDFCEAIFDFENTTLGAYDIFVQLPDTTISFKKGFYIEALKNEGLEIEILGPNQFRSGKTFSVEVVITNNSNQYVANKIINLDIESDDLEISLPFDPKPEKIPEGAVKPGELSFPPFTKLPEGEKIRRGQFSPKPIPPYGKRTMTVDIKSTSLVKISASESPYDVNDLVNFYLSPEQKQIECDYEYWRCRNDWTKSILDATSLDKQAEDLAWALGGALPGKTGDYVSVLGMANKAWDNDFISVIGNFTTWTLGKLGEAVGLISKPVSLLAEMNGILYSNIGVQLWSSYKAQKQCGEIRDICMSPYGSPIYSSLPVGSFDPNDKYGYRSPSGSKYFNEDKTNFTYVIEFENKETATAAAQEVFVTDTLDMKVFDIQSFKAGSIKIGGKTYDASFYARDAKWTIDMRPDMNYITYVTLKLDTSIAVAKWYFKSVDPTTLDWPTDPTAGFLPPNDSTGRGQGSVSFTIDLKKGLSDETEINNKATIVFDTNEPIVTPTWSNKKDIIAPTSSMFEPDIVGDNKALISWDGKDNINGSGLYCYNLYVKKGNENYTPLLQRSALTSIDFEFEKDVKYSFYVTAIDSAENVEIKTNVPEINLEIIEVFAISKKWDDVLVCNNTGSKYTSYQWYKNGNPIQGAIEQYYQEIGGLNGSYFVMVTTTDGKIGISNVISVGDNTKSVKVYPNPLDERKEYTVEIKAEESELTSGEMIVSNVNGQLITRRNGLQPQMKLNGLIRGVYLVKVQFANGESFNEKLIVK